MKLNKKNVVLGFNGDRDSQLSALLLSKQGYNISGVYYYINSGKVFNLPDKIISKFSKSTEDVSKKAKEIRIVLSCVDVTDIFIAEVLEYVLSSKLSFLYVNYAQIITNFIINNLAKDQEFVASGHYLKVLNNDENPRFLMHSDTSLDQSCLFSKIDLVIAKKLLLPLGDLALREREKLVKDYSITNLEQSRIEVSDISNFVPDSLVSRIELDGETYENLNFELDEFKCSVDSTFIITSEGSKSVSSNLFECIDSNLKMQRDPQKLFVKISKLDTLYPVVVNYCSLSRLRVEFSSELDLELYCGQVLSIYSSSHKNSMLLGSTVISKAL